MNLKFLKSRFATNTGWVMAQHILQMMISLVVGALSARYLGPSNYGTINYAASFVDFLASVCTLSMEAIAIKMMVDEPEKEGEILGTGMVLRVFSGLLCSISVIICVCILNVGETETIIVCAIYSLCFLFKAPALLDCWFQRYLKSKYTSVAKIVAYICVAIYKISLLVFKAGVKWFAVSNVLDYFLMVIILYYFYRKERKYQFSINWATAKIILKNSYHFIISGLMIAVYGQMDKLMLKSMVNVEAVGLYSTASTICNMWIFIPMALINSAQPIIMEHKKDNESLYLLRLKQLYSGVIWLCLIVSIGVCILGPFLVKVLYGAQYVEAAAPLSILIWSETFSMIGCARGIWIVCENKNKYAKYYLSCGVVVNLTLNAVLIPQCGISGAAFATLVTQIVTSIVAPLFFKGTRIHTKYVLEAFVLSWLFKKKNAE